MAIAEPVNIRADGRTDAPKWTETTRLMSAAAYLEGTFAQEVIDQVVDERFRATQVPEGVDIVTVVRHCLAARRQKDVRDAVLACLLVVTVVAYVATTSLAILVLGFLAAWATVAYDIWASTYHVATKRMSRTAFRPDDAPVADGGARNERLAELAARRHGNVTVYSGFNPFAGSGFDLGGWSFAMDLRKGRERVGERLTPRPFECRELYDAVTAAASALEIPGLEIDDRLFVNGTDVRDDRLLLPEILGRPVAAVGEADLARFAARPTHHVRFYKCLRIVDWHGELVVSLFLRFSMDNGRLFTELSRFVLTPLRPEFRRVDGIDPDMTLRQGLSIIGRALGRTLPLWLRSPAPILRPLFRLRREARELRRVKRDYFFDYGASATALDRARSTQYTRYFQMLDREMYVKVLERCVLDTIVELLDRHDVDTTELTERRETIINNGIMVPGGTVQANNIAVGEGAKILSRLRPGGARSAPAGQGA